MNAPISQARLFFPLGSGKSAPAARAFTVVELLVVIAIMGIMAAIGLPAVRGIGKANATISAERQMMDDLALARQRAIVGRTDVYMVFVPPGIGNYMPANLADARVFTNRLSQQYIGYALLAARDVGEQPGQHTFHYLTPWRTLPQGTFIAAYKFVFNGPVVDGDVRPFLYYNVPFPQDTSAYLSLPCILFDYQGRLKSGQDEVIPLARGSIFYPAFASGALPSQPADVLETPPGNSQMVYNGVPNSTWDHVRVDWLTGRARAEHQEIR